MKRPKVRIGTLMLLVIIAGLAIVLFIQQRRLAEAERRIADLEAKDAGALFRWSRPIQRGSKSALLE